MRKGGGFIREKINSKKGDFASGLIINQMNSSCNKIGGFAMSVSVTSEVGCLRAVLMHTPGAENLYVPPSQREHYLIEDILHVPTASAETRAYQTLIEQSGAVVHRFQDMLTSLFAREDVRRRLLRRFGATLSMGAAWQDMILSASASDLAAHMVTGNCLPGAQLPPLPNLAFQRDIGIAVGSSLVVCSMKEVARKREMQLFDFLVEEHPYFEGTDIIRLDGELEGGDVLVIRDNLVVMGYGHRTKFSTIMDLSRSLLRRGVDAVIAVAQPDSREHMHLDTVFTIVSENRCVMYAPAILGSQRLGLPKADVSVITRCGRDDLKVSHQDESLLECLTRYGTSFEPIFVGGGDGDSIDADQEQWWDGANTFAISPGKIAIYDRNERTIQALEQAGFKVCHIQSEDDARMVCFDNQDKVVFAIASSEICKARGGPHCLTMPLCRNELQRGGEK